jgi:hypothetical protein
MDAFDQNRSFERAISWRRVGGADVIRRATLAVFHQGVGLHAGRVAQVRVDASGGFNGGGAEHKGVPLVENPKPQPLSGNAENRPISAAVTGTGQSSASRQHEGLM